jgi:hypothetical protein
MNRRVRSSRSSRARSLLGHRLRLAESTCMNGFRRVSFTWSMLGILQR